MACMPKSFAMPGERYMLEKKNLASYAWPAKLQSPSLTSGTGLWRIFSPSAAFRMASSNTSETSSWGSTGSNTSKISARQVGSSARKLVIVASHNLRLGTTTRFLLVVLNLVVRQLISVTRATTWFSGRLPWISIQSPMTKGFSIWRETPHAISSIMSLRANPATRPRIPEVAHNPVMERSRTVATIPEMATANTSRVTMSLKILGGSLASKRFEIRSHNTTSIKRVTTCAPESQIAACSP